MGSESALKAFTDMKEVLTCSNKIKFENIEFKGKNNWLLFPDLTSRFLKITCPWRFYI